MNSGQTWHIGITSKQMETDMNQAVTTGQGLTAANYKDAIFVQSTCNLSGVVHGFSKVISRINEEARLHGHGTDWINNHPICRLYAEQIYHLTRNTAYHTAYDECEERGKA